MKASIKLREDQKPLLRAKVPLSILGLPFQSGIVAGESKELTLNLGTFFESGPSVKIAYRPNDTWNPFSVVVKTGTGHLGSPAAASSVLMSAEFSLLGRGTNPNPRFMLHVKPRFGDFSIRKSQSSSVVFDANPSKAPNGGVSGENDDDDCTIEVVDSPVIIGGSFCGKRISIIPAEAPTAGAIAGLLSGVEVAARTTVPVRNRAVLSFRWGVRIPSEIRANGVSSHPTAGISFQKIPFLVMNKIGIEHVGGSDQNYLPTASKAKPPPSALPVNADMAEFCFKVKCQLEVLQAENGLLRKAVEDLRRDFALTGSSNALSFDRSGGRSPGGKSDRRGGEKKLSEVSGFGSKLAEPDMSEELKKA